MKILLPLKRSDGVTPSGLEALEFLERSREMASEPVVATPVAAEGIFPDEPEKLRTSRT